MYKSDVENYHVGDYISASMMSGSGCMRQTFFERFEPFFEIPNRRYWAFRGTHAHTIIEGAQDHIAKFGWLQEIRMATQLLYEDEPMPIFDEHGVFTGTYDDNTPLVITVRGTTDAYLPKPTHPGSDTGGLLVDMKTFADSKADQFVKGTFKDTTYSKNLQDSWVAQLNIYAFLIGRTPIPDWVHEQYEKEGLPKLLSEFFPRPTELFIQGVAMMSHPVTGSTIMHKERYGKSSEYTIDSVPCWDPEETEAFIRPKALAWYRTLNLKIKPPIVEEKKAWICKSCCFRGNICFPETERPQNEEAPAPF